MSTRSTTKGPSCPKLKAMRHLRRRDIIRMAFRILPHSSLQALFNTQIIDEPRLKRMALASTTKKTKALFRRLVDSLYYNEGARLCRQERWNEMTRLQLENEVLRRGMVDELEEEQSELMLRAMLAGAMLKEREERKAKEKEESRLENESELELEAMLTEAIILREKAKRTEEKGAKMDYSKSDSVIEGVS